MPASVRVCQPYSIAAKQCYGGDMREPVEVSVGGKNYRVITSEDETTLKRLAATVDDRLRMLAGSGRVVAPHALVLVAIALAHELEEERRLRQRHLKRSREALSSLLARIDSALQYCETSGLAASQRTASNSSALSTLTSDDSGSIPGTIHRKGKAHDHPGQ